jgi:23S rRNA (cytidine1920-2'-O)/16S rRNA (cytidine1409-2'-O)-methyltransferase
MSERIRADLLLVQRGLFDSRARAQAAIEAGGVTADGAPVSRASDRITASAAIVAVPAHPYVSRGGVKLAAALDRFGIDPAGRIALDTGSSTGGFTEVLLLRGAAHVTAVDTGRDQLHESLRGHPRLDLREGTDLRAIEALDPVPDLAVIDVSFISLTLILPGVARLLAPAAEIVALVKPQFEVGKPAIGKGGIVRDDAATEAAITRIRQTLSTLNFIETGWMDSPIAGGDGNREYLLAARRQA